VAYNVRAKSLNPFFSFGNKFNYAISGYIEQGTEGTQ
jgi:hypothetical protein